MHWRFSVVYVQFAATAGTFLAAEMGDCQFEATNDTTATGHALVLRVTDELLLMFIIIQIYCGNIFIYTVGIPVLSLGNIDTFQFFSIRE